MIMSAAMRAKWANSLLRECPHPAVKEAYGTSTVPIWICFQCQHVHRYKWHGAVSCDYEEKEKY